MDAKELVRKEWKKRIEEWKLSGKSCSQWAKDNNLSYHQALYWRGLYSKNDSPPSASTTEESSTAPFVELPEKKSHQSGISIEIANIQIHIEREFDRQTLLACIQLLKQL